MARSGWNAHFPAVAGLEYTGVGTHSYPVQQMLDARAIRFKAQTSGPLSQLQVYIGPNSKLAAVNAGVYGAGGLPFIVDLMTRANYEASIFNPVPAISGPLLITASSQISNEDGSTPPLPERLEDPNDNSFLLRIKTSGEHHVDVQFADVALTGQQILNVGINYRVTSVSQLFRLGDLNNPAVQLLWNATTRQGSGAFDFGEVWSEFGDAGNWHEVTPAMVEQFNSTHGNRRIRMSYTGTSPVHFDWLQLYIEYVLERRLGTGVLNLNSNLYAPDQWITVPLHVPAATGAPSLVAGTDYVVLIRPAYKQSAYGVTGVLDLRSIADRGGATASHFTDLDWDWHATVNFGAPALPPNILLQPPLDGALPVRLENGTNPTNDSQPYEYTSGAQVATGQDARQKAITVSTGIKYGLVKAIVSASRNPSADLSVTVRNASTQAVIAGPIAASVSDALDATTLAVDDFGDEYHELYFDLGSDFTLSSTIDLQFSSTTPTTNPWLVALLLSDLTTGTDVTFGGASSFATGSAYHPLDQVVEPITYGDLETVIMTRPPTVTGSPVALPTQALTGGTCQVCPQDDSCAVTGIPLPTVTWTVSPVTGFAYYEVQRDNGPGTSFATIAKLSFAPFPLWVDYAAPLGVLVRWRIRVVQTSGATSLWSNIVSATIPVPRGADIIITAPTNPTLDVAYPTAHGDQLPVANDWSILDASETVHMPLYGKDGQIALRPTEKLGIQFTRTMLLASFCADASCITPMNALRNLMNTTEPYLVVRDNRGCSFFMSVSIDNVRRESDPDLGDIWTADVTFTETPPPVVGVT